MNHLGVLCSYSSGLFKCSIFPSTEHNIFFHRCLDLKNKSSSLDLMAENYTNKANEVFPSQPTFDLVLCRTHKFFMIVTIMIKIFKLQISSFELAFFIINMSASFFRVSIRMIWFSFFFVMWEIIKVFKCGIICASLVIIYCFFILHYIQFANI